MGKRLGFRAWGWEPLEARVAMSGRGHAVAVGALGDSLTDEYRFYPPDRSRARNWVEILAQTRHVDFGAYTTGSRGLPRNQGYANDWALSGATTQGVVGGELPGLAAQVAAGTVKYASVNMGTDDFLNFLEQAAATIPVLGLPADYLARLDAVEVNAQANFDTTVDTLLAANPGSKVVVATLADLHLVPIVAQALGNPLARLAVDAAENAAQAFNIHVRLVAEANPRVAVADLAALSAPLLGRPSFAFGGATIDLATVGDSYQNYVLADGIHPGTVAQGQIAEAFLVAADSLGAGIKPLGPAQVVRYARGLAGHLATTP